MERDAWFFVSILVFIFLVWIVTGGPVRPLAFPGPIIPPSVEIGGGISPTFSRPTFGFGSGSYISLPGSSDDASSSGSSNTIDQSTSVVGTGVLFGNTSPYHNIVSMGHDVFGARATNPNNEYIQISLTQNAPEPVNITGWTIVSAAVGNTDIIPKGTKTSQSGIVNAVQDIVLNPGEQAYIFSGQSPIGTSFEENKCIGYYSSFQTFSPGLPQTCPAASSELSQFYNSQYVSDASCMAYAQTLSRCQAVLSPSAALSGTCQNFLVNHLNYNGCVDSHYGDADFEGNTWRIYLGRTSAAWRTSHEAIKLLDTNGKIVDAFSY